MENKRNLTKSIDAITVEYNRNKLELICWLEFNRTYVSNDMFSTILGRRIKRSLYNVVVCRFGAYRCWRRCRLLWSSRIERASRACVIRLGELNFGLLCFQAALVIHRWFLLVFLYWDADRVELMGYFKFIFIYLLLLSLLLCFVLVSSVPVPKSDLLLNCSSFFLGLFLFFCELFACFCFRYANEFWLFRRDGRTRKFMMKFDRVAVCVIYIYILTIYTHIFFPDDKISFVSFLNWSKIAFKSIWR